MGAEMILGIVGLVLTVATTLMTTALRRLTNDVSQLRALVEDVVKNSHAQEVLNEARLGKLEVQVHDQERRLTKQEVRIEEHIIESKN